MKITKLEINNFLCYKGKDHVIEFPQNESTKLLIIQGNNGHGK